MLAPQQRTLVIYNVHHDISLLDHLNRENLDFFVRVGVYDNTDCDVDYIFFVPPAPATSSQSVDELRRGKQIFPSLSNLRVFERAHDCLGCSGFQAVLSSIRDSASDGEGSQLDDSRLDRLSLDFGGEMRHYTHFVFLDSSVRGPFLPRYIHRPLPNTDHLAGIQANIPWTSVFTDRLGPEVKLVGRTVSCEVEMHVQAPVWATDRVGLQLLLKHGALDCARDPMTARSHHELAATRAILGAGYRVDCLMLRYQGLNLTRIREMELPCTARDNPSIPFLNDGLPINPLEVVFVAVTPQLLASDFLLRRYTQYFLGLISVMENEISTEHGQAVLEARRERLARIVADCGASLDEAHLSSRCPGCIAGASSEEVQKRFIDQHVLHGYDYRFTIAETEVEELPFHYCESFLRYQAPDLSS